MGDSYKVMQVGSGTFGLPRTTFITAPSELFPTIINHFGQDLTLLQHKRDLAGPGVYLPASEQMVTVLTSGLLASR